MLSIVIQAGGESSRMGQDKALMPFLGQTLIVRIVERLSAAADELIVTTNHPDDYRFLGLRLASDLRPGRGALGGLYTALCAASYPLLAVIACDMPFASRELVEFERDLLLDENADAVIPSTGNGLEPLHAVYRRTTCLPAVENALNNHDWKLISWFPQVKVRILSAEETSYYDPHGLTFWNLNTPEEFHQAEAKARETGV